MSRAFASSASSFVFIDAPIMRSGIMMASRAESCIREKNLPAVDGFVHHLRIVHDADRAPAVRDAVAVAGIIRFGLLQVVAADILLRIWQLLPVERLQQIILLHLLDHVVRRADEVVRRRALLEARIHALIRVIRVEDDVDARFLLELREDVLIEVVAPAVDVERILAARFLIVTAPAVTAGRKNGERKRCGQRQQTQKMMFFHPLTPPAVRAASSARDSCPGAAPRTR